VSGLRGDREAHLLVDVVARLVVDVEAGESGRLGRGGQDVVVDAFDDLPADE